MQAIRFGIDLAKNVFQIHGVDEAGNVVVRRQLKRAQMEKFFAAQSPALIGMEACGSAHYWARQLTALGHQVKLMPASYVKAYVRRNKNDTRDAEACCEAVGRPTMRFVPIKTVEQQCARALLKTRDLLVRQRTQLANALRGHLYEIGVTSPQGNAGLATLLKRILAGDEVIAPAMRVCLVPLARQWQALEAEIKQLEAKLRQQAAQDERAKRLMTIPGVGPLSAYAVLAAVGAGHQFAKARDFAAWLGLTRRNYDTGGKVRQTGHISRAGDAGIRKLLVLGASSWLRCVRAKPERGSSWVQGVLARRPVKVAVVAQAARTARIIWAMLKSGQDYRAPAAASIAEPVAA